MAAARRGRVLVVDDDAAVSKVLTSLLVQAGLEARAAASGSEALTLFDRELFDVVVTDLRMPLMGGMELLRELKRRDRNLPVIVLTAHGSVASAVEAMKAGASDFLTKPFAREAVLFTLDRALAGRRELPPPPATDTYRLLGRSPAMKRCLDLIGRAARASSTVLIRGETGTGKELAARTIHEESARRNAPFVAVSCAALPDQLLESELFGYEKGAFTGATQRKPGRVELAEGGTLFLDEIGDVSAAVQVKLLRLLQERAYEPLGATSTRHADLRFIAATHRDLETMIAEGRFREDLFYRLDVVPITMPRLCERPEDIAVIASHFLERLDPTKRLDPGGADRLARYDWPGNVRQLENVVERLVVLGDGDLIDEAAVARELGRIRRTAPASAPASEPLAPSLDDHRRKAEREALAEALARTGGNRTHAARLLGISRRKLYDLLAEQKS